MKLESEFRIRVQLHQLEQTLHLNPPSEELAPSTWVKLLQPLSDFSDDEALLLCQCSDHRWVAWIPGYGEILLDTDEFCRISEAESET